MNYGKVSIHKLPSVQSFIAQLLVWVNRFCCERRLEKRHVEWIYPENQKMIHAFRSYDISRTASCDFNKSTDNRFKWLNDSWSPRSNLYANFVSTTQIDSLFHSLQVIFGRCVKRHRWKVIGYVLLESFFSTSQRRELTTRKYFPLWSLSQKK